MHAYQRVTIFSRVILWFFRRFVVGSQSRSLRSFPGRSLFRVRYD